ncbi:hypothetical protein Ddye_004953 [Dipteronia dyeriana]|uniref:RNase H type-1 domain-containing protein n=1 Tax=Dipteronia dyeriana TaxID=168575 RepID=A0AAE0CP61_9ROSI|nr:hypothetical protein Ddye_004953 [Dipteronia dyeriana]
MDKDLELRTSLLSWKAPPHEWVKLNVDGSMHVGSRAIAAGGVIRDSQKNWLGGSALNKGMGSVIEAGLWGILEGLKITWKVGYKQIVVESGSFEVVSFLISLL